MTTEPHKTATPEPEYVAVVREYIAARDDYEQATRPATGFAQRPRLSHADPRALRYRAARVALSRLIEATP